MTREIINSKAITRRALSGIQNRSMKLEYMYAACNVILTLLVIIAKRIMKELLTLKSFVLAILILINFSCKKIPHYQSNGEIIGYDARMCVCCGGTEITINNVQNPNGNDFFLIASKPSDFIIGSDENFPIAVTLDWKIDSAHCFGNYIDITRIARR